MLTEIVQQDAEPADAPAETPTEEAAPAVAAKPAPKELTLERELSADDGTFGTIKIGDRVFHTAELPSRGNKINISCIPEGTYDVVLREGSYRVQNVKGRSQITLRTGTYAGDVSKGYKSDSAGEILIGSGRYKIDVVSSEFGFQPQRILTYSEETLAEFQKQAGEKFNPCRHIHSGCA